MDPVLTCTAPEHSLSFQVPLTTYITYLLCDATYSHQNMHISIHEIAFQQANVSETSNSLPTATTKYSSEITNSLRSSLYVYLTTLECTNFDEIYELLIDYGTLVLAELQKTNNPILRLEKEIPRYDDTHAWLGHSITIAFNLSLSDFAALKQYQCVLDVRPAAERPEIETSKPNNTNHDMVSDERIFPIDTMLITPTTEEPSLLKDIYGLPDILKQPGFQQLRRDMAYKLAKQPVLPAEDALGTYLPMILAEN